MDFILFPYFVVCSLAFTRSLLIGVRAHLRRSRRCETLPRSIAAAGWFGSSAGFWQGVFVARIFYPLCQEELAMENSPG